MCDCDDCECCDWFSGLDSWRKALLISISIILFISFFLIGYSVTVLEPLDWGLEYDGNGITVDSNKLWESTRVWQGLGFDFVRFPRNQRVIIFSDLIQKDRDKKSGANFYDESQILPTVRCRTKEGLQILVHVFVGYSLTTSQDNDIKAKQLWDLYSKFQDDYYSIIRLVVSSTTRDVLSRYNALDIPKKRSEIGDDLFDSIKLQIAEFHFNLFPQEFETALTTTEVTKQELIRQQYLVDVKQIEADTLRQTALIQKDIIISQSNATAQALLLQKAAEADSIKIQIQKKSEALKYIKDHLGFTDCPGVNYQCTIGRKILTFLWIYALRNNNANAIKMSTSFPTPKLDT